MKLTTLSIAFDNSELDKSHTLIDSFIKKVKEYNREVEKSNRLLREQENLRKKLNVRVEKGKTLGLVQKDK